MKLNRLVLIVVVALAITGLSVVNAQEATTPEAGLPLSIICTGTTMPPSVTQIVRPETKEAVGFFVTFRNGACAFPEDAGGYVYNASNTDVAIKFQGEFTSTNFPARTLMGLVNKDRSAFVVIAKETNAVVLVVDENTESGAFSAVCALTHGTTIEWCPEGYKP